jgi:hypothetical protein
MLERKKSENFNDSNQRDKHNRFVNFESETRKSDYTKKKSEEERQIAFKKKFESIKVFTLMLSIDETLKNAQKTLFKRS